MSEELVINQSTCSWCGGPWEGGCNCSTARVVEKMVAGHRLAEDRDDLLLPPAVNEIIANERRDAMTQNRTANRPLRPVAANTAHDGGFAYPMI
jgi:hypothetical protein